MKLIWENKYSDTDENDEQGRWARIGRLAPRLKGVNPSTAIACIGKSDNGFRLLIMLGMDPISIETQSLEQAKEICEIEIKKFKQHYLKR